MSAEKLDLFAPEAAVKMCSWNYIFWKSVNNICEVAHLGKTI